MSNLVIEIVAPTIVAVIEKLIEVLSPKTVAFNQTLPQTPVEQAVRQQVVPAPAPQPPTYAAPAPQYRYAAPVNPTPALQQAAPAVPVVAAPIAPTPPNAVTSAMPAAPATTYGAPTVTPGNSAPVAAAPTYQIDDLARAAAQLMDAGKQKECLALLAQFQVQGLNDLKPEQFGAFATALRQMGAKL